MFFIKCLFHELKIPDKQEQVRLQHSQDSASHSKSSTFSLFRVLDKESHSYKGLAKTKGGGSQKEQSKEQEGQCCGAAGQVTGCNAGSP